jgi:SAM-dependent methyltransferase
VGDLGSRTNAREEALTAHGPGATGAERYGFLHDPEGRRQRGRRIVHALADFGHVDLASARILDVGCSAGLITIEIDAHAGFVVGTDLDMAAVAHAAAGAQRALFVVASGLLLPFADSSFDAVVCNHVYEHVDDPHALLREIHRVLRVGGSCYFAGGHTLQLIEPHHRLPLLSLLPRPLADRILRSMGRHPRYEERFLAPWRLRSLFSDFARAEFVSPAMLRDPVRYEFPGLAGLPRTARGAVATCAWPVAMLAPTWIWMLHR